MKYIEFGKEKLKLVKLEYEVNKATALVLVTKNDEPYVTMTVNLPNYSLSKDEVILDTNNFSYGIEIMKKYELGKWTNNMAYSGFCAYPIFYLDMEKIKEYTE